ncbi:unnamed protein product [Angiostrongylus costaricensis]|uniref:Zinc transporter 6 n=1 Tax=Angiostrongylus costaricensis TaxID=334426 RepID=A0A0R3PLJ0_ANGCS|nr:unnamed protein product [Angiostrongylus costaricensis]
MYILLDPVGPLIMVYAFVRDHVRSHHRMWNVVAVAVFSAVCFTLSVFRSLPTVNEKYGILASDLSSSVIYLIVAALVVIFVHLYGEREYLIDLCELYTLKEKENPFMSPTYSRQFVVFDAVPFAFLQTLLESLTNVTKRRELFVCELAEISQSERVKACFSLLKFESKLGMI